MRAGLIALAAVLAVTAGAGWAFGLPVLTSMLPGLDPMMANMALVVLVAAIGAALIDRGRPALHLVVVVCGVVAAMIGLITFAEYLGGQSFGIDELLVSDPNVANRPYPGRMSPGGSLASAAIGTALILMGLSSRKPATLAAHWLALVPAAISLLSLVGHAFGVGGLYSTNRFSAVAFETAIALSCLSGALLFTRPHQGWLADYRGRPLARRVLMQFLVLSLAAPVAAGFFVRWGLLMSAYDTLFAPALFSVLVAVGFVWFALRATRTLSRAEGAIRDSAAESGRAAALLGAVLASVDGIVFAKDLDGRYIVMNEAGNRLHGKGDSTGRTDLELFGPDAAQKMRATDLDALESGQPQTVELDMVVQGERHIFQTAKSVFRDVTGAVAGVVGVTIDVTARRAAERRDVLLLALEDRLKPLTDASAIKQAAAETLADALTAARVNYASIDEATNSFHIDYSHVAGNMPVATGSGSLAGLEPMLPALRAGQQMVITDCTTDPRTARFVARDEIAAFEVRAVIDTPLVRNGMLVGNLSVNHPEPREWTPDEAALARAVADRTWAALERVRAETELRASQALLAARADEIIAIYNAAPVGLCVLDRDLRFVRINELLAEINGVPAADHIGRTVAEVLPDLGPGVEATMARVLAGEPALNVEITGTTRARPGELRTWRENWLPLRDGSGNIVGVTVSAEDVTEAKAAELRQSLLLDLAERLRASPRDALMQASILVGERFGASRTGFGEMSDDGSTLAVIADHHPAGVVPHPKLVRMADYGGDLAAVLQTGRTLVVNDVTTDPRTAADSAAHIALGSRANIAVPLMRDGRLRGTFHFNRPEPHRWTEAEISLIEEVAHRAWAVAEQSRAEEELRETSRRLDAVLDNASVAIFLMDDRQHCAYMNRAAEELTGFTLAETQGRPLHDVVHHHYPDGRPFPIEECPIDRAFLEQSNMRGEGAFIHKDGHFYPVAFVASPITDEDDQPVGTIIEVRDITQEKAAQAALVALNADLERRVADALAERRMLAQVVESTDVLVAAIDQEYYILAANRAFVTDFEQVYGIRPKAGDNILGLLDDRPTEREAVRAAWSRGLAGEEYSFIQEFGDSARERRAYEVTFRSLRDEAGQLLGTYQFVTDVSQRLRNQAELEAARAQLHEMQKLETIGQLTGGVAHDFNNLLTPIVGGLDLVRMRVHGDDLVERVVDGALQSAERAKVLIQRLLAFARRQTLLPQPVEVAGLVEGMRDLIDRSIGPNVTVLVDLPEGLPVVSVDPNQLELALLNLCVNARDAMPDGGELRIAAAADDAPPPSLPPGRYVRLSVSDTGSGMDAETLRRAVEPFFSTKGLGRGTGLGLSMVHGLAAQSGGRLEIASAPGQGTQATLWLPVSADVARAGRAEADNDAPQAPWAASLLLVDDEELVRASTAESLRDLGYDVVEVGSATEALAKVRAGLRPDALITDHMMPGMSGADLAGIVRARLPGLPVLLITGYANLDPDQTQGLDVLAKPFRLADLARRVSRLLEERVTPLA